ncbi:hypothetical protein SI65_05915 [Aspergillus cristatus]|uniref:Uncharacterized protein n=1 Tax=Aspergillus cristatus TaxID=573508 RepID=A0A1E3BEH4_ASPCR|nr:hypothetical protein SI65_05915 [Aspergillus cristatus]
MTPPRIIFNHNLASFRKVPDGYAKALFEPKVGTCSVPSMTEDLLEGVSLQPSVHRGAEFEEGEHFVVSGPDANGHITLEGAFSDEIAVLRQASSVEGEVGSRADSSSQ